MCAALLLTANAAAARDGARVRHEIALANCIVEKDTGLAIQIRDADSQEAFAEAFEKGAALCGVESADGMSLGKFFTALNAALRAIEDKK